MKGLIKTISRAGGQAKFNAWSIPYSEEMISMILNLLKEKTWLDYPKFEKINLSEYEKIEAAAMNSQTQVGIEKFGDWIQTAFPSIQKINNK